MLDELFIEVVGVKVDDGAIIILSIDNLPYELQEANYAEMPEDF
jgi:hypothetical protein